MSILNVLQLLLTFPLSAASCRKCPYRLGIVQCICNPCPACRQGGYKMFTGYVYEKRRISDKGQVWLIENRFYNKCWGQYRIGADFSIIFLQNKSI